MHGLAEIVIVSASAVIMLAAAFAVLRLAYITGRKIPWMLITLALMLMVIYRAVTLSHILSDSDYLPLMSVEMLGLATAVALLLGVLSLEPLLKKLRASHEQLRLSEVRYRRMIEESPVSTVIYAPDGTLKQSNPAFRLLWNLDEERAAELPGSYNVLSDPAVRDRPGYEQLYRAFMGESSHKLSEETQTPDGRWFLRHVYPIHDEGGELREVVVLHLDITERKAAEEELAGSRKQLEVLLSNLPGMVYRCRNDHDWTMDFVSGGSLPLTGYTPEELQGGITYNEIIQEGFRHQVWEQVQAAIAYRRPFQMTYCIATKDGEEKWVWEQGRGNWDEGGELLALEGFITDITARKRAEDALAESEKRFRGVIENNLDLFYKLDLRTGQYDYVSPSAYNVTGYSAEELQGMGSDGISECIHPDDRETVRRHFRYLRDHPEIVSPPRLVYRWLDKAGKWRWLSETRKLLLDGLGELESLVGSTRDVTERIQAEREVIHTRTFLQNVIDSTPSIVVAVDIDGNITLWNRRAEEVATRSSADALGKPFEDVLPFLQQKADIIRDAIRNAKHLEGERILPTKMMRDDRVYDVVTYPLHETEHPGAVIRVDDITSRVQFEEMMIQTEKMMSVGGLAAGMAHEINNPLGGILQACQNIERRTSPELPKNKEVAASVGSDMEQVRRYLEAREIYEFLDGIRADGARAARIVNDMLQYSRQSSSRMAPANVQEMIETVKRLASNDYDLRRKYDFKRITIEHQYDPEVTQVRCEKVKVEQVLLNLLKNAAQAVASIAEERPPRIDINTRREGPYLRIDVIDNGPGMDEATQRRVFEPFFTTKEVGEGTGLGLSVSYFIITKQHAGSLHLQSTPGQGTCFTVRIPLQGPPTQDGD